MCTANRVMVKSMPCFCVPGSQLFTNPVTCDVSNWHLSVLLNANVVIATKLMYISTSVIYYAQTSLQECVYIKYIVQLLIIKVT